MQKYYDKTPTQGSTNPVRSDGLNQQLAQIGSKIGDLTQLETTDKTDLVSAINEVKNNANTTAANSSYTDNYGIGATNVQDAIDKVGFVGTDTEIDLSQYTEVRAYITPDGKWITTANSAKWYGIFIPVTPYKRYRITANSSGATSYAFLKSNTVGGNNTTVTTFATGCSRVSVDAGQSSVGKAPSDAKYMWVFTTHTTTGDRKPQKIEVIRDSVADILAEIDSVPTEGSENLVKSGGLYEEISGIGVANTEGVAQPDLDIADEYHNVIVRFEGGHIKTKNFDSSKMSITVPSSITFDTSYDTDIIATSRNYILREVTEGGTDYFYFSDDCGKTWSKNANTIGNLTFIHFFSNGVVLLCCNDYCYTTTDFVTFTQSSVYDYDGSAFVSNTSAHSFYRLGNYNYEYHELNGQEVLIWNDYNVASGYTSRVWMSLDYGATIRCILKNGTTKDTNNTTISVRHFHRVCLEDEYGILWVTSGDSGTQCRLTKGTYSNGSWTWETIGTPGALYKLSQLEIKRPYAYFVTDYTDDVTPTGIVTCPVASLDDTSAFKYIYKTDDNDAMSKLFEDGNGNRVLVGDGAVYNTIWLARGNYDFKKVQVSFSSSTLTFGNMIGANFLGQVICFYNPNGGYSAADNQFLSDKVRFLFSDWMHDNGIADFGSINSLIR